MSVQASVLTQVFATSLKTGLSHKSMVDLLKTSKINWSIKEDRDAIGLEFKLGRIAAYLGLKTREQAKTILDKPQPRKDLVEDDKHRTEKEHLAYRASVSAWNNIATQAGMPRTNAGSSTARVTRAPSHKTTSATPAQEAPALSPAQLAFAVPKARKASDVGQFAVRLASMARTFQKENAALCPSDLSSILADFDAKLSAWLKSRNSEQEAKKAA